MSNFNSVEMNKAAAEIGEAAMNGLIKARASFSPAQKGAMTGALLGGGVGVAIGGAVGAAAGFVWQHKGKVALAAAAVAAFAYREEITGFATGLISGESAGGDAFM